MTRDADGETGRSAHSRIAAALEEALEAALRDRKEVLAYLIGVAIFEASVAYDVPRGHG